MAFLKVNGNAQTCLIRIEVPIFNIFIYYISSCLGFQECRGCLHGCEEPAHDQPVDAEDR